MCMPRNKKRRFCRFLDSEKFYKPQGIAMQDINVVEINLDEFEAIRLCDHDKLNQIEAGEKMKVSRGTIQRLLDTGRYKIIDAMLNNKALKIRNENI